MRQIVLVVDDEPEHRVVTRIALRLAGYDVREAASGEGAMVMLNDFRPDAIVLDIRLPGIDGLAVLAHLRSSQALETVPVVLCSAHATGNPLDVSDVDGLTTFVEKPFHPDRLVAAVNDMLPP
jgi:CheY-like chemotaxis protein